MRILFVCLGNICRSPTAEGLMRHVLEQEGLTGEIEVESAGTGNWHVGSPPDRRATKAAAARGYELRGRARQVDVSDFRRYDLLIAMDRANRNELLMIAPDTRAREKVKMLREFDPECAGAERIPDVPDPYYGPADGFDEVVDIIERSVRGMLEKISPAAVEKRA
jgi:protein-tyrosine phosphatase